MCSFESRLDRLGVEKIAPLLRGLSDEEGGRDLCLLCYEDVQAGQVCHRRMFAEWFEEKVGIAVEELDSWPAGQKRRGSAQDTLF